MAIQSSDIAKDLQQHLGISANTSKACVDYIFKRICEYLENNEEVNICRFGKFETTITAPKTGRNIRTGEIVKIAAKRKIKFTMSRKLSEKYNNESKD